jgi:hypothetical protein
MYDPTIVSLTHEVGVQGAQVREEGEGRHIPYDLSKYPYNKPALIHHHLLRHHSLLSVLTYLKSL